MSIAKVVKEEMKELHFYWLLLKLLLRLGIWQFLRIIE